MPKFFLDKENINKNAVISGEDASHIGRVLRMKPGDEITLCDKEGTDYICEIIKITKEEVFFSVKESMPCPSEMGCKITLYQCIPKSGKMDYIIQKATELGASEIVPVLSARCVAKGEKPERWQKIAYEAAKQCQRGIIPKVRAALSFHEAIEELSGKDLAFFPYEEAKDGKLFYEKSAKSVGIMIGPEGGFDKYEAKEAEKAGINICSLGRRILRTETAGSAAIAVIAYLAELT